MPRYWLMKSEPDVYSIEDLRKDKRTYWDGVRNYQARNSLRDGLKKGDLVLYYHSNAEPSGVAGVARVVREGYPDPSALDKKDDHYDPKHTAERPIWYVVDVEHVETFKKLVPLEALKAEPRLKTMLVIKRGMRLSVQPVEGAHFDIVRRMGQGT
ncbi:MAG: hypothetical protein MOGMAGMI_00596 [Candidatus Omnitrophica bacterium]|nr:hypothetical protein [Candidatus Omnitrophota bacterium]